MADSEKPKKSRRNKINYMKKILFLLFFALKLSAQDNVYFQNLDGTKSTYAIQTIKKFTISNNKILIHFTDGTTSERGLEELQNYKFQQTTENNSAIKPIESNKDMDLNIYPNPFSKQLNIKFNLAKSSTILIMIYDVQGKKVEEYNLGKRIIGSHSHIISTNNLPSGDYIISLVGDQSIVNKKITKQL
jgi:hypothetical protein